MCKGEYLSHILRKSSTQIYAICVIYALIKSFGVKLYSILRCFSRNLRSWQKIYATVGRTGRAKYQLWTRTIQPFKKYLKKCPRVPELIFGGTSGTGGRVNFFVSCVNFLKNNAKCYIISTPKGRFQLDFLRKILAAKTAVAEIFWQISCLIHVSFVSVFLREDIRTKKTFNSVIARKWGAGYPCLIFLHRFFT